MSGLYLPSGPISVIRTMKTIRIAQDFTPFPGGRYPEDGDGNGTTFRENFLVPVLENGDSAEIVLDGARGYPSSFLEEAFGGLVRSGFAPDAIKRAFKFVATQPGFDRFILLIDSYVAQAAIVRSASPT